MAKKQRQAIKKRASRYLARDEKQELIKEVDKQVKEANERLKSLSRRYKTGTWATKKLINRLDTSTVKAFNKQKNIIKYNKNMTVTQLKSIQKAINLFMKSKTSTKKGIKQISTQTKKSIQRELSLEDRDIEEEDVESFYNMLSDNDFNYLSDKIGASDLWAFIQDAKDYNYNETKFINLLNDYIDFGNDLQMKESAIALYNKYVA